MSTIEIKVTEVPRVWNRVDKNNLLTFPNDRRPNQTQIHYAQGHG
jgi:hypothetical protein